MDVLFLLGQRPPQKGDHKHFRVIEDCVRDVLKGLKLGFRFVVSKPAEDPKNDKIKLVDLYEELQSLHDFIHAEKPKLIVAMGQPAFNALALENNKITEIQCEPQVSPMFGKAADLRKTAAAKKRQLVKDESGRSVFRNDKVDVFTSTEDYNPIIWPCHKHDTFFAFYTGYKGMTYFIDQMKCVAKLVEQGSYQPHSPTWFDPYLKYYNEISGHEIALTEIEELKKEKVLSFDIETAGPGVPKEAQLNPKHPKAKITLIAFGRMVGSRVQVSIFNTLELPQLVEPICELLKLPSKKLSWNGKFDINFIRWCWHTHVAGVHIDGLVCLHLYDMGRAGIGKGSATLKTNCSLYLSTKFAGYHKHNFLDKAMKEGDGAYIGKHIREFERYCGIDVFVTHGLAMYLWNKLQKKTQQLAIGHYKDLSETLNELHEEGMFIDTKLLESYIKSLSEFCEKLSEVADNEAYKIMQRNNVTELSTCKNGVNFSVTSKPNIAEILYDILGLPPNYTDKGNYTVDKKILSKHQGIPFAEVVLMYNYWVQQLRLMQTLRDHTNYNGYCFPFYNDMRTASGRLSCCNPNIQQMSAMAVKETSKPLAQIKIDPKKITGKDIVPHREIWYNHEVKIKEDEKVATLVEYSPKFKKVVIAPPGYVLVYADYAQIEIYVLGNYIYYIKSKDDTLQTALMKGWDIHSYTTSKVYSILYGKDFSYEFILENKTKLPYKLWRGNAKTIIFSLIYGKGYQLFAKEQGIDEEDAKKLFDVFIEGIPGIKHYMDWAKRQSLKRGYTETIMGHERKIEILKYQRWNKKGINQSYNTPIQGSAGTIVVAALIKFQQEIKKRFGRNAFTVHDSIGAYVKEEHLEESIEIMRWCMEDYPTLEKYSNFLRIPLKIELGVCIPSWDDEDEYALPENKYYRKLFKKGTDGKYRNSNLVT